MVFYLDDEMKELLKYRFERAKETLEVAKSLLENIRMPIIGVIMRHIMRCVQFILHEDRILKNIRL